MSEALKLVEEKIREAQRNNLPYIQVGVKLLEIVREELLSYGYPLYSEEVKTEVNS